MAGSHGHPRGQDGQGTGQATSLQEPCGKGNDHALDIHTQSQESLREAGIAVLSLGGSGQFSAGTNTTTAPRFC